MVGAGVFSLPRRFAEETGVAGALIAWAIAGTGMLMLAFVFQSLAMRRPDLDAADRHAAVSHLHQRPQHIQRGRCGGLGSVLRHG